VVTRSGRAFVGLAAAAVLAVGGVVVLQQGSQAGDDGPKSEKDVFRDLLTNRATAGAGHAHNAENVNPVPEDDSKHLSETWTNSIGRAQPPLSASMFSGVNAWNGWSEHRIVTVYGGSAGFDDPQDGAVVMVIWEDSGGIAHVTSIRSTKDTGALKILNGENDGLVTLVDRNGETHTYDPAENTLE